jgi:purine-binding chemotaxis protein CheW
MTSFNFTPNSMFTIHKDLDNDRPLQQYSDKEQYIGISIGDEEFLLSIVTIREIILLPTIAYVPNAPDIIEGVINLRGTILPAISMRKLMQMPRPISIKTARVVVAKQGTTLFGLIVDGITNVISLMAKDIQNHNLPKHGPEAEFIGSICKLQAKVKGILDLGKVLKRLNLPDPTEAVEQTSA